MELRTLDADIGKLESVDCNALFCPTDREIYPNGVEEQTTVAVPTMVPFPLTAMVTAAVLLPTVLPKPSLMVTTGWVVNAAPLAEPAAWVVSTAWVAAPKVGVMFCVPEVSPVDANVRVYGVPAVALIPTPLKVATPFTAFTVTVPMVVPLPLTVMVTAAVLLETVLPEESLIATTG